VVAEIIRPDQKLLDLLCSGERQAAFSYWTEFLGGRTFAHHAVEKIIEGVIDPIQAENRIGRLAES
jgi:hypothetical protein